MTSEEKRKMVAHQYSIIIGRNIYSQNLRDYCYTKYKDGRYYSDCSSSICYAYNQAGFGFGIMNTAGIYNSSKLTTVDVEIDKGVPTDFGKLRIGDMLEFAGSDASRPQKIGHIEMIYSINSNGTITICGHGSGTPSFKDLTTYCKQRYNSWASGGWRKGLVCIRRYIQDDGSEKNGIYSPILISVSQKGLQVAASSLNVRSTPNGVLMDYTYKNGDYVHVKAKTFINNDPWFQLFDGNWVSAKYLTGWVQESNGKWWYLLKGYQWHQDSIQTIEGNDYNFDKDGYLVTGWFKKDNKWMYSHSSGIVAKSEWIKDSDGRYYYINNDSCMTTNAYVKSKDKDLYYWVNNDGVWEEYWNTSTPNLSKYKLVE